LILLTRAEFKRILPDVKAIQNNLALPLRHCAGVKTKIQGNQGRFHGGEAFLSPFEG
jgi:hypothetical protein